MHHLSLAAPGGRSGHRPTSKSPIRGSAVGVWGSGLTQVSGAAICTSSRFRKILPCFPQCPVLLEAGSPLERSA